MYQVTVETYEKKSKEMIDCVTIDMNDFDTGIRQLEDLLYSLDVEYDDIEGDGDMIIDDMLMSVSEDETFEEIIEGKKYIYKIVADEA